jgi:hypothetical protein
MLRNRPFGLNMTQAGVKTKNAFSGIFVPGTPKEIRTLVLAACTHQSVKGLCPISWISGGIEIPPYYSLNKKALTGFLEPGAPKEIRTLVLALKGLRPGPLDDGGIKAEILP